MVGNKRYVAGEVVSKIVLEDPSGIVEKRKMRLHSRACGMHRARLIPRYHWN